MKHPQHAVMIILLLTAFVAWAHPLGAGSGENPPSVEWTWNQGSFLPQGNVSSATVTVRNTGGEWVTLKFVGLRFDWMPETSYLYGDESERERPLAPQTEVEYTILFNIPKDASPGLHTAQVAVKYSQNGVDQYVVYEPSPPLNVIEVVTVVYTEVVVETVTEQVQPEKGSNSTYAVIGLSAAAAVILVLAGYTRSRRREGRVEGGAR